MDMDGADGIALLPAALALPILLPGRGGHGSSGHSI